MKIEAKKQKAEFKLNLKDAPVHINEEISDKLETLGYQPLSSEIIKEAQKANLNEGPEMLVAYSDGTYGVKAKLEEDPDISLNRFFNLTVDSTTIETDPVAEAYEYPIVIYKSPHGDYYLLDNIGYPGESYRYSFTCLSHQAFAAHDVAGKSKRSQIKRALEKGEVHGFYTLEEMALWLYEELNLDKEDI